MKKENQCVYEFSIKRKRMFKFAEGTGTMSAPEKVAKFCEGIGLGEEETERMVVLMLDVKNNIRAFQTVALGSGNQAIVSPRDVFRTAIMSGSMGIVLAHNHPSNSLEPSTEDLKMAKMIIEAGKVVGIDVLDFVIVSEDGHYSFMESGMMPY